MSQLHSPTALTLMALDSAGTSSHTLRSALRANVEGLALLEGHLSAAKVDERRARETLAAATAAHEAERLRVNDIEQQMKSLSSSTKRIQRSLHTLAQFPVELLSLIFEWANTDDGDDEYEEGGILPREINIERLKLPWRLSAVCTLWRRVARQSPTIWSYVAIPDYGRPGAGDFLKPVPFRNTDWKLHSHLDLLLRRSSRAPIDVVIAVGYAYGQGERSYKSIASEESQFIHDLLARLSSHLQRVRTLHVDGRGYDPARHDLIRQIAPDHLTTSVLRKFFDFLRAPTPRLVDVRLNFDLVRQPDWYGFPETPLPMLLPQAPRLRTLSACHVPIAFRRGHPGLPSLSRMKLEIDCMHGVVLADTLSATPALEELTLSINDNIPVEGQSIQLPDLASLRVLHIQTATTFELLEDGARHCPSLTNLALHGLGVSDLSVTPALAGRLVSLALSDCEDLETHVPILRELDHLVVVELWKCTMQDDVFFAAFCDADRPMWPRLAVLRMWRVQMCSVDQDGILQFVRKRCSPENKARWKQFDSNPPADAYPRPLAALRADRMSVPMWVLVQIQELYPEAEEGQEAEADHRKDTNDP